MAPGLPTLTENEYRRDYDIIRNDVNAAMVSCYTHRTINTYAVRRSEVYQKLQRSAEFWRVTSFSLHTTLFILLARILDHDPDVHSVHRLLNATLGHPEFFSKQALRARKLSTLSQHQDISWLDEYVNNAWEPTKADLRELKKALGPHKVKFDDIYRPIRHQIAHIIEKDEQAISALYSKTLKTDVDEILCFLHNLVGAIWDLGFNAARPDLTSDQHGYASRVREIETDTQKFLESLR